MSSANKINSLSVVELIISFIYIRKSNGPSTETCGTPYLTKHLSDDIPSVFVCCVLQDILEFVFRFQDDLISFNDHGLLQDSLCEIYPPVMIVNNTNISACKSNFLDMTISIYQGKFYFSLYDKRNDYDFDVISFPFLDGNIPKGQSYGVFISQLVRYARINCSFSRFIDDVKRLVQKLILTLLPCVSVFRHLFIIILMFGVSLGLLCQLVLYFSITYFFSFNLVTVSGFFKLFFTYIVMEN